VSSALLLFKKPVIDLALGFMGADLAVGHHAETYLAIRMWSAPATLSSYALIGWFIGMQNARAPLILVLVTNSINILLDLWFVVGLGMQVDGVAAASVIAEYSGIFVAIFLIRPLLRQHPGRWQPERLSRLREYRAFLGINANLFVRTIALVGTFTFVTAQGARLGGLVLAANAILMNFQNLLAFALDGLAHAAEALVGKATGAGDRASLLRSVMLTRRWSASIALAFSALFYAGGPALIGLLTDLPHVRQATLEYLPWMVLSPVISVWPFLYDGVFVGATRASEMRNSMLFSVLAVFIPAWYVLQPWGNHGLWLAFLIFMAARAASMHYLYKRRIARE
jgi:MATE family multidrug resistance protein